MSLDQEHQPRSTKSVRRSEPTSDQTMRMLEAVDRALHEMKLNVLDYGVVADDNGHQLLATILTEAKLVVAAESGAVARVIDSRELLSGAHPDGIVKTHFVGASSEHIENY